MNFREFEKKEKMSDARIPRSIHILIGSASSIGAVSIELLHIDWMCSIFRFELLFIWTTGMMSYAVVQINTITCSVDSHLIELLPFELSCSFELLFIWTTDMTSYPVV